MRLAVLLAAVTLLPAQSIKVSRASLATLERSFDRRLERSILEDPLALTVSSRGVYLANYGAVFTSEVNLVASAAISPFRPQFTKEELAKIKEKKKTRIPLLKATMREMLISSATALDFVPAGEQIVVDVAIFYFPWEDSAGLPREIMVQAPRKALLEASRSSNAKALDGILKEQEF